jgi:hypothetical protein
MNTVKENKDISKLEARIIQYSKIFMMAFFLLMVAAFLSFLFYKIGDKSIAIQCF